MQERFNIRPGDLITTLDGRSGLVVSIHENEYGTFYNMIVNNELVIVDSQIINHAGG
jgi:hypothetical protein